MPSDTLADCAAPCSCAHSYARPGQQGNPGELAYLAALTDAAGAWQPASDAAQEAPTLREAADSQAVAAQLGLQLVQRLEGWELAEAATARLQVEL